MRWPLAILVLLPVVVSLHACGDVNQPGEPPSTLQHQPDVPSIGDREYRDRDPFNAAGGSDSTGGSSGTGGAAAASGGNASHGGQGGEAFGGAGGENSR